MQQARLIPTSGINGTEEAERRATAALLAVMGAVRELGQAMVKGLGAPGSHLETFIEVPFQAGDRTIYPDGELEATRAGRTWTCLVEVKTSSSELERSQVESYLDVAKENDFDCVLTISNQIAPSPGIHALGHDLPSGWRVPLLVANELPAEPVQRGGVTHTLRSGRR